MNLSILDYYLIIINIIGFILFAVNVWLYNNTPDSQVDGFLTLVALAGGSIGIVIAIFLIDRKAEKGNMMSRVFVFSILVIQIVIVLFLKGHHKERLSFAVGSFFTRHKTLIIYLIVINIATFIAFAIDKMRAIEGGSRIKIVTLLAMAFFGGTIGGLLAMYLFRHKTRKDYFTVGMPLIVVMQIVVLFYAMNMK